jgi:hypothetical protein
MWSFLRKDGGSKVPDTFNADAGIAVDVGSVTIFLRLADVGAGWDAAPTEDTRSSSPKLAHILQRLFLTDETLFAGR